MSLEVSWQPETLLGFAPGEAGSVAVDVEGDTISWAELERRGRALARALDADGPGEGGHWAALMHNRVESAEVILGNVRAGTRVVPLNWHLTPGELAELLTDSESSLVVCDAELAEAAREAARLAGVDRVLVIGDDYEAWRDGHGDGPLPLRTAGSPMMYTGGTTGRSKGVTRSDSGGTTEAWAKGVARWGSLVRMPTEGRTLITTPLYHAFGSAVFSASLATGVPVVATRRFSPERTLALIESERITAAPMVPTQFIKLLKLDPSVRSAHDLRSIRWVLHTAAPCPGWAKRAMIDWLGPVIFEMYGASEGAGPAVCDSEEWLAHPGTVGRASAAIEYSIVGDDGRDLPPGEVGTIYVRRPDGAPTYHAAPDKTAAMRLPDGRFTVGDIGWLDDDGYLYLADRRVDLMLIGGTNVYPAEIEAVLVEHPSVGDAAVFGIPHPEMGEEIKAVVEPAEGAAVDADDLRSFLSSRLAAFKIPKSFDVVDALPREAHGKLKKRLLRDPYWSGSTTTAPP